MLKEKCSIFIHFVRNFHSYYNDTTGNSRSLEQETPNGDTAVADMRIRRIYTVKSCRSIATFRSIRCICVSATYTQFEKSALRCACHNLSKPRSNSDYQKMFHVFSTISFPYACIFRFIIVNKTHMTKYKCFECTLQIDY